ncbi:MAG: hypothetical protein KAQ75_04435 [Bacteroidales bacterium]|nr:hypothetical protein [Bacteroidales bacterium]
MDKKDQQLKFKNLVLRLMGVLISFISLLVFIYSIIATYNKEKHRTNLSIELSYFTSLILEDHTINKNIEIYYENECIKNVSIISFNISNKGNSPIIPSNFVSPIQFTFPPESKIHNIQIKRVIPSDLNPIINCDSTNKIILEPLLLNPEDFLSFEIMVSNLIEKEIDNIIVTGRVVDLEEITLKRIFPQKGIIHGISRAYDTDALIVIPISVIIIFLLLSYYKKTWSLIIDIFHKRPTSKFWFISVNLTLAVLISIALEDIFEGLIEVIKSIM